MRVASLILLSALCAPLAAGVAVTHMVQYQGRLVLVGRDDNRRIDYRSVAMLFIAKKDGLADRTKGYSVIREIGGRPIFEIDDVEETADGLIFWSDQECYRLSEGRWTRQPLPEAQQQLSYWCEKLGLPGDFGSDQFPPYLVRRDVMAMRGLGTRAVVCGYRRNWLSDQAAGILMLDDHGRRFYRLPPPGLPQLKQYRPQVYAALLDGIPRNSRQPVEAAIRRHHRLEVHIGAHARLGDFVWVATAFRDSGQNLGIGALAAFDLRSRNWRMEWVRELSDWSASTLLVEEDTFWIGLCRYRAEDTEPGGLMRVNMNDGSCDRTPLPSRINRVARFFGRLHLATENGLYIMTPTGMRHVDFGRFGAAAERDLLAGY